MAVDTDAATSDLALSDTNINWDRLDKTRFHVTGAILFTAQSALLHPMAVVKTRMQVAGHDLAHRRGFVVFRNLLMRDGISGVFRGFGTSAIGSLPGRVLALTSLEVSKAMVLEATHQFDMPEATRIAFANGVADLSAANGPYDVIYKALQAEGYRGLYRGFGITALTQSPASALWWGVYWTAQHAIWRSLGYNNNSESRPSHLEMVSVQATAGTFAGVCSSVITTPIDTIKTRLQVMDDYGAGRPSVMKTARALIEEDGWRGFYRGFGPRFLNMSLWGTSMIVTYELIKRLSVRHE